MLGSMTATEDPDTILTEEQACSELQIPPFLLRDFVVWAFNGRKLEPVEEKKKPLRFKRSVVLSFKEHLESRWPGDDRPPIPTSVQRYLLIESAAGCGLCLKKTENYDNAHIRDFAKSRCHSPHNLIRLCVECHRSHGDDAKTLQAAKELARNRVFIREVHVREQRIEKLESEVSWLRRLFLVVALVLLAVMILMSRGRRVDIDRLATKLRGIAAITSKVQIQPTPDAEALHLAQQLEEAFKKAGNWDVTVFTRTDLGGRGVAVLAPPTAKKWEDVSDPGLKAIADSIEEASKTLHMGGFEVDGSPNTTDYRPDVITIRVLLK
jgi:hypothetical protein